jgi:large subunit ribosomal protein L6e
MVIGMKHGLKNGYRAEYLGTSTATMAKKTIGGAKNGGSRVVAETKAPKYYPADDVPVKVKSSSGAGVAKLRKSIKPGTVLILLAGRFRGKRVVFLKQLPSGLLLVTGPYAVNGVPLRRVNQAYVIATSTTVNISSVKVDKFSDSYFGKAKAKKGKKGKDSDKMFAEKEEKSELKPERVADQKEVDAALKVEPMVGKYLKARFSLSKRDAPHKMCF